MHLNTLMVKVKSKGGLKNVRFTSKGGYFKSTGGWKGKLWCWKVKHWLLWRFKGGG